jgi:hypothetical protein
VSNTSCNVVQARRQGGFWGLHRTPLLSFFIHMNLYITYASHTHLIKVETPFVKKDPRLHTGLLLGSHINHGG